MATRTTGSEAMASSDKELRKRTRRSRIFGPNDGASQKDERSLSSKNSLKYLSEQQVSSSLAKLENVQAKSSGLVTEARVNADQREVKRRDDEEEENRKRQEVLKKISLYSQDEDCIKLGWEECMAAINAQDLCSLLDRQKVLCDNAVLKLEGIMKDLGSQLREKDNEYVTALKRNRKEIEMLQDCISREHQMLKETFETELKRIEESYAVDRDQVLNAKKIELEAVTREKEKTEINRLERQLQMIDDQRKEIKDSESKGVRDSGALKEQLEAEFRRLEIELERTRARHHFDSDKLEYDVRVLTDLSENEEAVKKQKRRIMKGKEEQNREIETNQREKAKGTRENGILEADCERIEKQSIGLREKFERFKLSDEEKYQAILALHRDDLRKLQGELNDSQDFIFGRAIGCGATEQSCASDVTFPDQDDPMEGSSVDEFGLEFGEHTFGGRYDRSDEWNQAEVLMTNYRNVLEQRENLNSEARLLEQQNEKLEKELRAKLRDPINDELTYPPSMMISVDDDPK